MKTILKRLFSLLFGNNIIFFITYYFRKIVYTQYVIAITYHDTPSKDSTLFEKQLVFLSKYYKNCSLNDLKDFIDGKHNFSSKPGIIFTFDDGLYSNYLIAVDLLEKYGFTGYFMIAAGFPELDISSQYEYARKGLINYTKNGEAKVAMGWNEIIDLHLRGHVIGCHGYSHCRLSDSLTQKEILKEIIHSRDILKKHINSEVEIFTWIGGEEWAYGKMSFDSIKEAGYKFIFCTNCKVISSNNDPYFIERYHSDSHYDLYQLKASFSFIYDILYWPKRFRINKKLNF